MTRGYSQSPFAEHAKIEEQLLASGGPFETVREDVFSVPHDVFKERPGCLRDLLEGSVAHGDAEYIVYEDERITFREHARNVASVAKALREIYGVGPGDRVAILAANCPEWIMTWWAAVSLGAIAVGLNGWWVRDEILYGLGDCQPKVLIGDAKRLARLEGSDPGVPVVEIETEFKRLRNYDLGCDLPKQRIHEDDPACILYTSGTTGKPKGAVNTHRNAIALCRMHMFHGLRLLMIRAANGEAAAAPAHPNCTLINSPLFHVSGLYTGAITLLSSGVKTVWTKGRFDPAHTMEVIERERVTSWGPMGAMAYRVVNHPDVGKFDLSSIRQVGSGGAPIGKDLQDQMRKVFPNASAQMGLGYGLTEATGMATINFGRELEARPDSVGRPMPTMEIEIRGPDGKPVPEGSEGEIHLRAPIVMRDYWEQPEATRESILAQRWLRTGDWGRFEEGYLYVNSRKRDLILRGGENVYPAEIEQALEAHPDIDEAAVLGVAHEELGQEVKAILVPRLGAKLDAQALARYVGDRLAYFKVPAHWEVRARPLPRNAAGKILKHVLKDDLENPYVEE